MNRQLVFSITYLFIFLISQILATPVWSQTKQTQATASVSFDPPDGDRPKNTAGGASRNDGRCSQDPNNLQPYITAVLPADRYGLTVESHPTFLVYLPPTSAQKAFFSIKDESDRDRYQTFLSLKQSGVMEIKLPADAPGLEIGKTYKWSFVMMCDSVLRPDSPLVEGQIQRIEMNANLSERLKEATPIEQAALYGKAGIWYDTVATLVDLKRSQPKNSTLATIWEDLLESVELGAIADRPLVK
ncbi:MAG: DUF928 domain-containing protein [Hydrococcus sp. Prado102]|jgi:hypothetical protein|nr:DUF928 domain-containing protein [Hydrococcus sp. Prado102]